MPPAPKEAELVASMDPHGDGVEVVEKEEVEERDELKPTYRDENSGDLNMDDKDEEEEIIKPTWFSDDKGNLKVVNMVVRHPCGIFWTILAICILIQFLLIAVVFRNGNPFSEPGSEYDVDDIRSIQYDSLRLAQEEVQKTRDERMNGGNNTIPIQSEDLDLTYWVFEGETPDGVFGSADSIKAMKEAFDLFLEDQEYDQYCKMSYGVNATTNATEASCDLPITPLLAYYASEWDTEMVASVIEELKDPEKVELFNELALCYTLNQFCELVPEDVPPEQIQWAISLGQNLTTISSTWDMKGELVQNFQQVTELATYLIQVDIFRGTVIFGYDENFGLENPISQYSRGILLWGSPLNIRGDVSKNGTTNAVANNKNKDDDNEEETDAKEEQDRDDLKE